MVWDFFYGFYCKLSRLDIPEFASIRHPVRIMSYNIQALFPFYNAERIQSILSYLIQQFTEQQVDIVCLQEAFEVDFYERLYAVVSFNRLYISHPPLQRRYYFGENSGLVIISRWPIQNNDFQRHDNSSGLCGLANKGYQCVQIQTDNDRILRIVNTHLQSDNEEIAIQQLQDLIWTIGEPTIVLGDMNLGFPTMKEYIFDTNVKSANDCEQTTFPSEEEQYDYGLLVRCSMDTDFEVLSEVGWSDHYPIRLTIV